MKKSLLLCLTLLVMAASMLTACSGNASASPTGTWKLISYGSPANPTPAAPDVDTSIEFASDGTLTGNVGCNGFGGDYKVDGDKIVFGQIMSTLMFCEGPVGEQEATTLAVFTESAPFAIDGNTLTITSADGSSVVVLAHK